MPQMAPLNWLTLFLFFSLMFILFNLINYYSFLYNQKEKKIMKQNSHFSWKW